jgi:hypothetical protein
MMNVPGFTEEALAEVNDMLDFSNPFLGQCNQKKLRAEHKQPRTAAQQSADQARSQKLKGHAATGGNRSEAAKKAAATRARCKGGGGAAPAVA